MNLKVGDKVWYLAGPNVSSGTIVDVMLRGSSCSPLACVRTDTFFHAIELKDDVAFPTQREALLALMGRKQAEASRLLGEAAELVKRASAVEEKPSE